MIAFVPKIIIVTPVFNDWAAFTLLLKGLGESVEREPYEVHVLAIDDGSAERADTAALGRVKGSLKSVQVIRLACNLGHQRAIAVGLVRANALGDVDAVVVMDSDGEDRPADVPKLLAAWEEQPDQIVVAERGVRSEGFGFRTFYKIYKLLFQGLTGQPISFGNFSLLPKAALAALVHNPALWNNIAATIARSRVHFRKVKIDRGKRLAGRSRMNFVSSCHPWCWSHVGLRGRGACANRRRGLLSGEPSLPQYYCSCHSQIYDNLGRSWMGILSKRVACDHFLPIGASWRIGRHSVAGFADFEALYPGGRCASVRTTGAET